jgi:hypothetical protein
MSRGDRKCGKCARDHYRDSAGELIPLEVCYSHAHSLWLCLRCYLGDDKP